MHILLVLAASLAVAVAIPGKCGVPAIKPDLSNIGSPGLYIVGGKDAVPGSWPWQASMRTSGGTQFCGGALIHEQFVLTAAHCFYRSKPEDYEVGLGYYHINGDGDDGTQLVKVKNIINHENYNDKTLANDITLIHLAAPVKLSTIIDTVCLPTGPIASGEDTIITGWGDAEKSQLAICSEFFNPKHLQQAVVPIIDRNVCNQRSWYNGDVMDMMICAGYPEGGIDSCQGDSGGPLVWSNSADPDQAYHQHGITSWGYGCADAKNPGVYTDVWQFVPWINQKIAQYGG